MHLRYDQAFSHQIKLKFDSVIDHVIWKNGVE
jgi:hypothetical protein